MILPEKNLRLSKKCIRLSTKILVYHHFNYKNNSLHVMITKKKCDNYNKNSLYINKKMIIII